MRLLLIDNYDSFTFNLFQAIRSMSVAVEVVRNDRRSADRLMASGYDGVVLSPGPGTPLDAGVCLELVRRRPSVPILGVCLGHQVLAHCDGADVHPGLEPRHGKTSPVSHHGDELFDGVPSPFEVMRYHSLIVAPETLSADWRPLAWADDGVLMAMRHTDRPYWGIQFHPESILTPHGPRLIENFVAVCSTNREARRESYA